MQEKVLSSKKNGMTMMILFILLYAAATALRYRFHAFPGIRQWCSRIHLVIFGMDSVLGIKSIEATGSSGTYFVW